MVAIFNKKQKHRDKFRCLRQRDIRFENDREVVVEGKEERGKDRRERERDRIVYRCSFGDSDVASGRMTRIKRRQHRLQSRMRGGLIVMIMLCV